MKKIFLLILLLISIASCKNYSTHGKFITEHPDAWIDGYVPAPYS